MLLTTMMKNNWKDYWIGLVCTVQGTEGANEFLSKIFSFNVTNNEISKWN